MKEYTSHFLTDTAPKRRQKTWPELLQQFEKLSRNLNSFVSHLVNEEAVELSPLHITGEADESVYAGMDQAAVHQQVGHQGWQHVIDDCHQRQAASL